MTSTTPTVGRTVHYVSHGTPLRSDGSQAHPPACRVAVVTEADPEHPARVGLCVINPTGFFFHPLASGGAVYDDSGAQLGGTWHWPERA